MTDKRPELAHGGIASREGDMATLGDGVQWWLNGAQWARDETDALIPRDPRGHIRRAGAPLT